MLSYFLLDTISSYILKYGGARPERLKNGFRSCLPGSSLHTMARVGLRGGCYAFCLAGAVLGPRMGMSRQQCTVRPLSSTPQAPVPAQG
jgi:hypothetical protein